MYDLLKLTYTCNSRHDRPLWNFTTAGYECTGIYDSIPLQYLITNWKRT